VETATGAVSLSRPSRDHWLNLDSPALLNRPCVPGTGERVLAQRNGYALLSRSAGDDYELVSCTSPRRRRLIVGEGAQLGGGWMTWRDHRSNDYVTALRLRDRLAFRFRLPPMSMPQAHVIVAHTADRIFVADDLGGRPVLRIAQLPQH
jgi:hypothetical protein